MMKFLSKTLMILSFGLVAMSFSNPETCIEAYAMDIEESTINWTGSKIGGEHTGTIALKQGTLDYNDGVFAGGSFEIDMMTITNTDLGKGMQGKLVGHLKSVDFFDVENHPTAAFNITEVMAGRGTGLYTVTGDLTIKGITHPISFETTIDESAAPYRVKAEIEVDRTKYDVRYGSASFFDNLGDKAISDEFKIAIDIAVNVE